MKFRKLPSVPEGKTITEKYLYRVLISSICSIFLCIGCLAGTTWAWFAVSIENVENVIAVASNPEVVMTVNGAGFESNLGSGTHIVSVAHAGEVDDVQQKSTLYVTFSLNEEVRGYVMLNHENSYTANINITTDQECILSWTVSWFEPDNAEPAVGNSIELRSEKETEPTEESTEPTEEAAEPTETETEPIEETTEPTETETEPAEETTEPTEAETDPTEETTQPTETETDPTEITTQATEAETEPAEETIQPMEAETESTEVTTQSTEAAETTVVTESDTNAGGNDT